MVQSKAKRRWLRGGVVLGFLGTLAPFTARAQSTPTAPTTHEATPAGQPSETTSDASAAAEAKAAEHFRRGVKLFDEGDFKLALVEFERSYELVPNYRTLYNLGEVEFQLGHFAKARRTLTRYLELGGERLSPNRRAEVERDIDALKIRTATLRVDVDVEGADIEIDGEHLGRSPLANPELVDAGAHRLTVHKQGYVPLTESLSLVGGDSKVLALKLVPVPTKREEPRVVEVQEQRGVGAAWIGWGVTAALAAGTVGAVVAWQNAESELTALKGRQSSQIERKDQASSVDTLETVTIVMGGATLAVAGVSLYFTLARSGGAREAPPQAGLLPRVLLGPASVGFRTEF